MHSHNIEVDEYIYFCHTNGDFSGDVVISNLQEIRVDDDPQYTKGQYEVRIPFGLMEELVGRKIADDLVSYFEEATGKETLKFLTSLEIT